MFETSFDHFLGKMSIKYGVRRVFCGWRILLDSWYRICSERVKNRKIYEEQSLTSISINGRFLMAEQTGVQRVARQLLAACCDASQRRSSLNGNFLVNIVSPCGGQTEFLHPAVNSSGFGRLDGTLWEQLQLPFAPRRDLLLNLCNTAPLLSSNSITMIHDAQVYTMSESYSRAFRTWYKFALPHIGRRSRRILTVSNYSADQLAHFGIAPREKISVIHNGADHLLKEKRSPEILDRINVKAGTYFLGPSTTQPHKNVRVLVDAFRDRSLADETLVLFGSANRQDFEKVGIALPRNVLLTGRVVDSELRVLMEDAKAFLFPSKTEGFGLPPLEAMSLGTPAICASAGALPEVCGEAAIYADPNDFCDWVKVICAYNKASDAYRAQRAKSSLEQAKKFTWAVAGERLLDIVCEELGVTEDAESS